MRWSEFFNQLKATLEYPLIDTKHFQLTLWGILVALLIIGGARFILWLIRKFLDARLHDNLIDRGRKYAYFQAVKYIVYLFTILLVFEATGIQLTLLLASSTALFVGLGLGLQALFKDLISGFLILTERTITAGDIIEVDGLIGRVKEVDSRTTKVITRDDTVVIVPNHKFVNENVKNWTQNSRDARFRISVGVAYGSDVPAVRRILLECADAHGEIKKTPAPHLFFSDFGESALQFELLFHSENLFRIEKIKSDLRLMIEQKFRDHGIRIPFPQRDVWFKNADQAARPSQIKGDSSSE